MIIESFHDPETATLSYIVFDKANGDALIIDPILNLDLASGEISHSSVQKLLQFIEINKLHVHAILETHAHADHLSGAQFLKKIFPSAVVSIGERIKLVQETFKKLLDLKDLKTDASQFDHLFKDQDQIQFGTLKVKALATPGHTPACMSYLIGDAVFCGDTLFMPDYGTGRCDFPQGSAKDLYQSVTQVLYRLPDATRVFVGHDYAPNGREVRCQTTIAESKQHNIQLNAETQEQKFIQFREARDKTLKPPQLLFPSIQVNVDAGRLPTPLTFKFRS